MSVCLSGTPACMHICATPRHATRGHNKPTRPRHATPRPPRCFRNNFACVRRVLCTPRVRRVLCTPRVSRSRAAREPLESRSRAAPESSATSPCQAQSRCRCQAAKRPRRHALPRRRPPRAPPRRVLARSRAHHCCAVCVLPYASAERTYDVMDLMGARYLRAHADPLEARESSGACPGAAAAGGCGCARTCLLYTSPSPRD